MPVDCCTQLWKKKRSFEAPIIPNPKRFGSTATAAAVTNIFTHCCSSALLPVPLHSLQCVDADFDRDSMIFDSSTPKRVPLSLALLRWHLNFPISFGALLHFFLNWVAQKQGNKRPRILSTGASHTTLCMGHISV
ncbi:hypothetical protein Pelo_12456 [Pelomyxa schiedti]|nr:hypothetical protein Pelo_12456 [Pelomyxa schiedti]